MSVDDLVEGLRAIENADVRASVAAGDVSAAGKLELNDEERQLLIGAAEDFPQVLGFSANVLLKQNRKPEYKERAPEVEISDVFRRIESYINGRQSLPETPKPE